MVRRKSQVRRVFEEAQGFRLELLDFLVCHGVDYYRLLDLGANILFVVFKINNKRQAFRHIRGLDELYLVS